VRQNCQGQGLTSLALGLEIWGILQSMSINYEFKISRLYNDVKQRHTRSRDLDLDLLTPKRHRQLQMSWTAVVPVTQPTDFRLPRRSGKSYSHFLFRNGGL